MGLLDEIKAQKKAEEEERSKEDVKRHQEYEKERNMVIEKFKTYLPLIKDFCEESGMEYKMEAHSCHYYYQSNKEYCHFLLLKWPYAKCIEKFSRLNSDSHCEIGVYLMASGLFGLKVLFTEINADTFGGYHYRINESKKDASIDWVKKKLLNYYENLKL